LTPKKCGAGAGWDGLRGDCGLEVCGAGAGKISQTRTGPGRDKILRVLSGSGQKISTRAGLYFEQRKKVAFDGRLANVRAPIVRGLYCPPLKI